MRMQAGDWPKWLVRGVALFCVLLLGVFGFGYLLPEDYTVNQSVTVPQSAGVVWSKMTDHPGEPGWRKDLVRVERVADRGGHPVWREVYRGGPNVLLETAESVPGQRLVRHVEDEDGVYKGEMTFQLKPSAGGTEVAVAEKGTVKNPFLRTMVHVLGKGRCVKQYLQDLSGAMPAAGQPEKKAEAQ